MPNLLAPVLVVENDVHIQQRLHAVLLNLGYKSSDLIFTRSIGSTIGINLKSIAFAIIDLELPDGNGLSIINTLNTVYRKLPILVLSSCNSETMIVNALQAGVTAYILKDREDFELFSAIRNVLKGGLVIDPLITHHIINLLLNCNKLAPFDSKTLSENNIYLTMREQEILRHIASGSSNQEIADKLYLSRYTIEIHLRHIYRKLMVSNRTKAISKARKMGLI